MLKLLTALSCVLVMRHPGTLALSDEELLFLFEDCVVFNASCKYGGPVCGSDGDTYPNSLYIRCMNYNLPLYDRVLVRHGGACTPESHRCPYSPFYRPVCASDGNTYANMEALSCKVSEEDLVLSFVRYGPCERSDPCNRTSQPQKDSNPVCATNGVTYSSLDEVLCLRKYNKELNVLHDGGCSVYESRRAMSSRHQSCSLARNRHEWNPMCGADNVTYPNMFVLKCCNPDLPVNFAGECSSDIHKACKVSAQDPRGTSLGPWVAVCGSDGVTYPTANHLLCATKFNKHLKKNHEGPCDEDDDPCKTLGLSGPGTPVCGSDKNSYVSPEALWCIAKNHNPDLRFLHDGQCLHSHLHHYKWDSKIV